MKTIYFLKIQGPRDPVKYFDPNLIIILSLKIETFLKKKCHELQLRS